MVQEGHYLINMGEYCYLNNKLLVTSNFTNKIFIVNPQTLKIEKEVPITSKYTEIGAESIPITQATVGKFQDIFNKLLRTKGKISRMYFDNAKQVYYFLVYHETPKNEREAVVLRAFSIFIYDTSFNKLGEQYFPEDSYPAGFCMMTSKGLLVSVNKNEEDDYKKAKFVLFKPTW